jgi:hypothetical protein
VTAAPETVPPFAAWLARVLTHGESVQDAPPELAGADRPAVLAALRLAFAMHALDVGGPLLPFDPAAAEWAAVTLARACWRLAAGDEESLPLAPGPKAGTPAAALSADVCLRFLPAVLRRARLRDLDGPLVTELGNVLRRWPLTGVLADIEEGPTVPTTLDNHPGLLMLYAERLADAPRAGWVPADGPAREWVERVFAGRGRLLPPTPAEARRDG